MPHTEHPLIFSAPMIKAIIESRKSVTRRLADYSKWKKGDRVWVRETHLQDGVFVPEKRKGDKLLAFEVYPAVMFEDDEDYDICYPRRGDIIKTWRVVSAIHMPRWASRITLELTADVRREPLQKINKIELAKEGFPSSFSRGEWRERNERQEAGTTAKSTFVKAWDKMHPDHTWESNPIVSVIEFKKL